MNENFKKVREDGRLLYEYIRGSHLYGLNIETSDVDTSGVFLCEPKNIIDLGFGYKPLISDAKNDNTWYEIKNYLSLLLKSNPTMMESLFVPKDLVIGEINPMFIPILENRNEFLSKKIFAPLFGYAREQISKARGLNKKIVNPVTERLEPLDFCYTFYNQGSTKISNWLEKRGLYQKYCGLVNLPNMPDVYGVYYDFGNHILNEKVTFEEFYKMYDAAELDTDNLATLAKKLYPFNLYAEDLYNYLIKNPKGYSGIVGDDKLSNELRLSSISKDETPICNISYNQTGYTKHCIDYKNYKKWENERNPVRYESNLNKNYDSKNIMHCTRLIHMGIELAKGEGFNVKRTWDREFLLEIRNHGFEYDEIMEYIENKHKKFNELIQNSSLKDEIDTNFVNDLLIDIRKQQLKLK